MRSSRVGYSEQMCYPVQVMHLAYFDESGDPGVGKGPTRWFCLNALLVQASDWLKSLDALVEFRHYLLREYGIRPRDELKGADFKESDGAFSSLRIPRRVRFQIYREILQFESKLNIHTFSVAINKSGLTPNSREPHSLAWQLALERLQRFCTDRDSYAAVFPDEGHNFLVRGLMRKMRRFHHIPSRYGGAPIDFRTDRILEDPSDRHSHDSYFVQLADLNAYATHRNSAIDPKGKIPGDLWDSLAGPLRDARIASVDSGVRGPLGVKVFP